MKMRFVLATGNKGKIVEMQTILHALSIETVTMEALGIALEVEETGQTFLENAILKAEAVSRAAGLPAIADDSGLVVDALGGAPGVHSRRYGGGNLDDRGLCDYLLGQMADKEQRAARFVCSIVSLFPEHGQISATGVCEGEVLHAPRGTGGFGYDPVFAVNGTGKSMAELSQEEKNAVSHRGRALRSFAKELEEHLKIEGRV